MSLIPRYSLREQKGKLNGMQTEELAAHAVYFYYTVKSGCG